MDSLTGIAAPAVKDGIREALEKQKMERLSNNNFHEKKKSLTLLTGVSDMSWSRNCPNCMSMRV